METESLKKRSAKTVGWTFVKTMFGQLRSFIVSIFLARLLGPSEFGTIGIALVFAQLLDFLVDFGFSRSIVQAKKVSQIQLSSIFWLNLGAGLLLSLLMFCSSAWIAIFFKMEILTNIVRVFSITFIIKAMDAVPSALFERQLNMRGPVMIEIISSSISGGLGIILAILGYGVWALVYSQVCNWIMATSLLWLISSWRPSFIINIGTVKPLWRFGYKYSLAGALDNLFWKLDTLIIGKAFSATDLGYFDRAKSLNNLVIKFSFSPIQPVLLSAFSKLNENIEILLDKIQKMIHTVSFTTCLFAGILYINAPQIVTILFSEKWLPCVPFFRVMSLFAISYTIPDIYRPSIYAVGHAGTVLKAEILQKCLKLIGVLVGLPWGIYAYVYATCSAELLGLGIFFYFLREDFRWKLGQQILSIFRYMLPSIVLMLLLQEVSDMYPSQNNYLHILCYGISFVMGYILINQIFANPGMKYTYNLFASFFLKREKRINKIIN